jgi:crotonobetainyl-CoA:carnitine CoA-transferase CaiB-like acyl-CoA transferase
MTAPLAGVLVVEHGERLGTSVCGSLLADLGAEVVLLERSARASDAPGRAWRALGKRSVVIRAGRAGDQRLLRQCLDCADVLLTSTDTSPLPSHVRPAAQITCDITAFGASGPLAGRSYSDALVQAVSGLADTTGDPEGPPAVIGLPFCEVSAGLYAAASVLVALRVRRTRGCAQAIDIALFDCAVSTLATFLPFTLIGKPATRAGNSHSLAAPWNAYPALDGWVLICTGSDQQWRRLANVLGRAELGEAPAYATNAERVSKRAEIDALVRAWSEALTVEQCIAKLSAIEVACGPIRTLDQLATEANLVHRGMVQRLRDPTCGDEVQLPGSPLRSSALAATRVPLRIPSPNEDVGIVQALLEGRKARAAGGQPPAPGVLPLAGLRVIEVGQYTTAPLVARQLGALGAEVYKVEPPGGESARRWPPTQGGRGYFFAFSNSDKRSAELDLRRRHDREVFEALLRSADVLVENLKPGALARLGFGPEALAAINPRLVYCGISGFGQRSIYPGRPAFDTVVQAMSGFMDLTGHGVPMKAGISAADIVGGQFALLAILAALEARDTEGKGQALDISMQDAAVWATGSLWNAPRRASPAMFVKCTDGYVCVEAAQERRCDELSAWITATEAAACTREERVQTALAAGFDAAPVRTVAEVAQSVQVTARELIVHRTDSVGLDWPLLNPPLRLEMTPAQVRRPIGELGEANAELLPLSTGDAAAQPE